MGGRARRDHRLNERLGRGDQLLGMGVMSRDPAMIELLGSAGFDFAMVDMEHSPFTDREVEECIRAGDAFGIDVLVRPELGRADSAVLLDAGAAGLVFAFIESAEQAALSVRGMRFPPEGSRGISTGARYAEYGAHWGNFREFMKLNSRAPVAVGLVESARGYEALPEICRHGGLDAVFLGYGDLAASLGVEFRSPDVQATIEKGVKTCEAHAIPYGVLSETLEELTSWKERKASLLFYSVDLRLLRRQLEAAVRALNG